MTDRSDLEAKTRYDPSEVEPRIEQVWLDSGLFHPEPAGDPADNYSIAIPLPNVTGVLHMGHALNNSIQDCLIRFNRMRGKRTKWILGTDHAGIATQTQVERAVIAEGTSREQLGREAFVALFEKGYIYRDRYMVNWDPGSRSAISDLEVEDREVTDTLYYVDYPLESGSTAIAVHPDDERYRGLIGKAAILPLVGRRLEIIADEYVKPEFGTGALKITPGHDPNDFDIGRKHGLPEPSVISEDG